MPPSFVIALCRILSYDVNKSSKLLHGRRRKHIMWNVLRANQWKRWDAKPRVYGRYRLGQPGCHEMSRYWSRGRDDPEGRPFCNMG